MDFCSKCGSVMVAKRERNKTVLVCRKCGTKVDDYKPLEIAENVEKNPLDDVVIIEKNQEFLPKTTWWIQQTRSSDEAPTLFLRCTKCRHSWREYG
jgi:DNA-directed RNA polymerase subunit M